MKRTFFTYIVTDLRTGKRYLRKLIRWESWWGSRLEGVGGGGSVAMS